jgi:riboflavin biosynthesis pyrimidine reductase
MTASSLTPLEILFETGSGKEIPLPDRLRQIYGTLALPRSTGGPTVIANFVQSIDGVVTLDSGKTGGGPVSGGNEHDRVVMGILRSAADAVIVGAGTLRSVPRHLWTPQYVYPDLADEFNALRSNLDLPPAPLNVIVTAEGKLDPEFAVLKQSDIPVLIVTTAAGASNASKAAPHAEVVAASDSDRLSPDQILRSICHAIPSGHAAGEPLFLLEAGPTLMSQFLAEHLLDELFLTIAPQVAGRDGCEIRPGLASGHEFAPDDPRWSSLVSVRRAADHLMLRYRLRAGTDNTSPAAAA